MAKKGGKNRPKKPARRIKVCANKLVRKTLNPMTTTVRQVCTDNVSISSVSGTPDIVFSTSAGLQPFYNLTRLGSLADFGETNNYEFVKLHSVVMEFTRSCDEAAMFNNVHGKFIYLAYYPILTSTAMPASIISRDARAIQLDLMTFDPQHVALTPANVFAPKTTTGENSNNSVINPRGYWSSADGEVCIASDNTINNIATVPLFT